MTSTARAATFTFRSAEDGDRYWNAVKVFGLPDIVHRLWDYRAKAEIAEGDVAVFAQYDPDDEPTPYSWNDSERF